MEEKELDLDRDDVYKVVIHTTILILVLIILPLIIFLHTHFNNQRELSFNILFDTGTSIEKIYNKLNYGSIRNV
ncbi:MAG: hypothetical protein NC218_08510 [Acetobacter sp.]|nr:hypothetical protein [Acetobacter sp.]